MSFSIEGEFTGRQAIPSWFVDELSVPNGASDIRVSAAEDVIGWSVEETAADSFGVMREVLESKGWVESETGGEFCSVFMKTEGVCQWAMVQCVPVGNATSVVVRCIA